MLSFLLRFLLLALTTNSVATCTHSHISTVSFGATFTLAASSEASSVAASPVESLKRATRGQFDGGFTLHYDDDQTPPGSIPCSDCLYA
jgi:hypothetical protein